MARYNRGMKLRIGGLRDLDPLAVPLPHGTEVTARVDRRIATEGGERVVPQGAMGRVIGRVGDAYDVSIVGVGVARYARAELVPRKLGQVRYALRREADWSALSSCVVLEAVVGSRAWGLADEGSDVDRRGAFVLPFPWTIGLVGAPTELVSADGSATYWELDKLVRQAIRADPNTLELLFVSGVRALDPIGAWLLDERDAFVSAEIYGSFGRYALSQLSKLEQSQRLAEHRALVLGWLRAEPGLSLDDLAERLSEAARVEGPTRADRVLRAKEYVKQLYGSLYDQGLVPRRELSALVELAAAGDPALTWPRELRPKNAYNLLRLIATAIDWLRTGAPQLELRGPLRDELLAIKRGQRSLAEVVARAQALVPELEEARRDTVLPARADVARADRLLRRAREEIARRWFGAASGPFGVDAPAPPLAAWEEP